MCRAAASLGAAVAERSATLAEDGRQPFTQQEWDAFVTGYRSQYVERSYFIDDSMVVDGAIPADLNGTLLRNGPGETLQRQLCSVARGHSSCTSQPYSPLMAGI